MYNEYNNPNITQAMIEAWVIETEGSFHYKGVLEGQVHSQDYGSLRTIMKRLKDKGIVGADKRRGEGWFYYINPDMMPMNFSGNHIEPVDLRFPFGLERYAKVLKKNIVIIAGEKDAGKTAFILNFIKMNMRNHRIVLFNSEMGTDEYSLRLQKFESLSPEEWTFEGYERNENFAEAIKLKKAENDISVIDFIEVHDEFWKVGGLIRDIFDVLNEGVAVIVLQKNPGSDLPRGGSGALEKARLVVNIVPNQLKIHIAKNWADGVTSSPKGKAWDFKLVGGAKFVNIREVF